MKIKIVSKTSSTTYVKNCIGKLKMVDEAVSVDRIDPSCCSSGNCSNDSKTTLTIFDQRSHHDNFFDK
jgi:hypothetical protein